MRTYRAGQSVEDHCRQCHEDRMHTVIVVDGGFQPLRTRCDFCGSEHNYRGGPRMGVGVRPSAPSTRPAPAPRRTEAPRLPTVQDSIVSARERRFPVMSSESGTPDLELLIRTVIREESGLTAVTPAEKWRGGDLVLRPGKPGLQERTWPIETFFHKIVMLRNRLRTLEQQVNASDLPNDQKLKLQTYITGCYGSLTSFNVLFADEEDKFAGSASD
jgi:hypothetical protein